ncbi:DUF4913 domain-containing protein [Streptomonospora sp. S1-112]|uniref:DUF4913 domain-containing protein n=1 Tax=Streptomonospora mangrovi TaxID=2883123 RepID=A0A9X3NKD9_9ACTN|nr:DUF4913 domain-containing protein [Streptomonospora mangrovi]MDA0563671.1 DUF4913 domain-containing protein [Streptomonospora mangrovi]
MSSAEPGWADEGAQPETVATFEPEDGVGPGYSLAGEAPSVGTAVSRVDENAEAPPEDAEEPAPEPVFKNVEEFVRHRFLPVYVRPEGGQFRWCKEWWRHAEAVSRFQALWHAWEVLRWEPGTGMAVWYRDHLDFQMGILLGDTGPFRECTSRRHQEPRPLPADPSPEGWFEDEW